MNSFFYASIQPLKEGSLALNCLAGSRKHVACILIVFLLGPAQLRAQAKEQHRITGSVCDQSGAPVPRVRIEVRSQSGQLAAAVFTSDQGGFVLDLPEGKYTLKAEIAGLKPITDYALDVGAANPPVTLSLEVPSIKELIVVTASRSEAPLAQVGSSVTVIRGVDLEKEGVTSIADALRRVPGTSVVQNGAPGQLTSLFMRGGESDYAKVLIDGIPINDPGGTFNFANLSTAGIDRIEIVRGAQSALFGSDATAGVIQIMTRSGNSEGLEPKPSIAIEGGSFATFRYLAGISGKGARLDYAASFARQDTDNNVLNGSFNDTAITGNLGLRPTRDSSLRVVFRSDAGRAGVSGQWAFHPPDSDQYYRHRYLDGGARFTHATTPYWTQALSYAVNDARQFSEDSVDSGSYVSRYQDRTAPYASFDFPFQTLNQSRRQKIGYQSDFLLPRAHHLIAGMEYERETGTAGDPRVDPLVAKRNNIGAFFQDEWALNQRLFAAAGVRLEHNGSYHFSASPRASLAWHLHQAGPNHLLGLTRIKANFGIGIKEPTLVESFSQSPYFLGNPNLKPERSTSYDVGLEQNFFGGKGVAEISWFDSRYRDQIAYVTTDFTTFAGTFFNVSKTLARGTETSWRLAMSGNLQLEGSYTFLDSCILENSQVTYPVFAPGQQLLRRPRHSGALDLKWHPGRWTLGVIATVVGSRTDWDFAGLEISRNPAYGVLDLFVGFRLFSGASLYLAVNNALDRDYMEVLGYPALPARFRIGLNAGF